MPRFALLQPPSPTLAQPISFFPCELLNLTFLLVLAVPHSFCELSVSSPNFSFLFYCSSALFLATHTHYTLANSPKTTRVRCDALRCRLTGGPPPLFAMRISSRASWLLSASLAYVAADDTAGETISFNSDCFNGFTLGDSGMTTTIIGYNDLKSHDCINITDLAWDFGWTSTDKNIQILSIILGNEKDQTQIARAYGVSFPTLSLQAPSNRPHKGSVSDSQGNSFAGQCDLLWSVGMGQDVDA